MRRFENYWLEEARWEEEQNLRRRERRKRTREERRARAREQMLTIIGVCLFLLVALLATTVYAESLSEETTEIAQSTDDGRLPGDDIPATERCYLTEDEVQEDFENEKIEDALLNRSHKLTDVTVTHYCPCQKCCGKPEGHPAYGITASGRQLVPGVSVGVDPSVIPLGSTVILDFGDGDLQYCVADDTGSGVKGKHIDLAMADHQEALEMGLVNKVVPFDQLEAECVDWARQMLKHSDAALRFMKASFNAATDGLAGLQQLAGDATLLYYTTDEAKEGRDAFKEKRDPDFSKYPKRRVCYETIVL